MNFGINTTLSDPNSKADPEVVAIAEAITPMQSKEFGKVFEMFGERAQGLTTDKYDVLTRQYTAPAVTLDAIADAAVLAFSITSGADRATVGDVLQVGAETLVIKTIDNATGAGTFYERGAGGSTAAAHIAGVAQIVGNAHVEGKTDAIALAEGTDLLENYAQIFQEVIDLSKCDSDQARKTGRTEDVLKKEAMSRIARDLARSAIYGVAVEGTAVKPAMSRGLIAHLALAGGIKTAVNGAFTETVLMNILDDVRKVGGTVNAIVLSVKNKRIANTFKGADSVVMQRQDPVAGRVIEGYLADGFGVIPFVVDIDFPDDKIALVNTLHMQKAWKENDMLAFTPYTNVGPREKKTLLAGKLGFFMSGVGQTHGLLTGIQ